MNRLRLGLLALSLVIVLAPGCKKKALPPDAAAVAVPPAATTGAAPQAAAPAPAPAPAPRSLDDPILKLLPKKAAVAFVLPRLDESGRVLKVHLERHAAALGIAGKVDDLLRSVALGVANPFDPASRARWGIDGKRSAAVALDPEGKSSLIALAVTSFDTFDKRFREKMKAQGDASFEDHTTPAGKITVIKRGGAPAMAYAHRNGFALVTPADVGVEPKAVLEGFLKVSPNESLATTPIFLATASKLQSRADGLFYFDGDGLYQLQAVRSGAVSEDEKRGLRRIYDVLRGFAVAVTLTERDIKAELYAHLDQAAQWAAVFPAATDFALGRFVASGAGIVGKLTVDGSKLLDRVFELDPGTRTKLARVSADLEKRMGINVERDVLRNLSGRFAGAFLGVDPNFAKVIASPKRRVELFNHLHIVVAAELKDPPAFHKAILGAMQFLKQRTGARLALTEKTHGTSKYYELSFLKAPVVSVGLVENVFIAATGKKRIERTLDLIAQKGLKSVLEEVEPAVKAALASNHNGVAVLNLGALLGYLKKVDLKPLGRQGVVMKNFIDTRLTLLFSKLEDVIAVGRFDGQGVRLEATIRGK